MEKKLPESKAPKLMHATPRAAGVVAIAAGALVLIGWTWGVETLKAVLPGLVAMNPATAVAFILSGLSLWLLLPEVASRPRQRLGHLLALLVTATGAIKLNGYLFGWDGGVDQFLFRDGLGDSRMAPNTACSFALIGLALLTLDLKTRRGFWLAQLPAWLTAAGSLLALMGYAYGASSLYGIASFIPMALNTAGVFLLLSLGVLCARPECGVVAVLSSAGAGGVTARRLMLAAIIVPAGLGWLRVQGQHAGLYDTEFGAALMAGMNILTLLVLVWWTANTLNRADAERQRAAETIQLYADIVRNSPIGLLIWRLDDPDDPRSLRLTAANPAASSLLGVDMTDVIGTAITEIFPAVPDADLRSYADVARLRQPKDLREIHYQDERLASNYWAVKAFPLPDRCVGLAFENVTVRKRAEEAIRTLNAELERRVNDRTRALAETNKDLTHKNQEIEMFVYSVSHDLRSPLVNLQGFSKELGLLCQDIRGIFTDKDLPPALRQRGLSLVDEGIAESIHFIRTAVMRLSGIIDALLRLSRAGRVEYQWQDVDVAAIVARVVDSMGATITERRVTVTIRELPHAWGDPTALEQVFANLIGNALFYLDPQRSGVIEIGCEKVSGSNEAGTALAHHYYVKDNGLGIPAAYQHKVFQVFQRLHPEAAKGEGIGLAIVQRIVQRHGGKVWVESTEGVGSTFNVALPGRPAVSGNLGSNGAVEERKESATWPMSHSSS